MKPGPKGWRRVLCHLTAATVAIGIISPLAILLLDRRPVVAIYGVSVTPMVLMPGQPAFMQWNSATLRFGCGGVVRRQLVDGAGVIHEFDPIDVVLRTPEAPGESYARPFIVPLNATPGQGTMRTHVSRWCNVLQQVIWSMPDRVRNIPVLIGERPRNL